MNQSLFLDELYELWGLLHLSSTRKTSMKTLPSMYRFKPWLVSKPRIQTRWIWVVQRGNTLNTIDFMTVVRRSTDLLLTYDLHCLHPPSMLLTIVGTVYLFVFSLGFSSPPKFWVISSSKDMFIPITTRIDSQAPGLEADDTATFLR